MLTIGQIEELVEACSYKPGWSVNLHRGEATNTGSEFEYNRPYIQVCVSCEAEASMESAGPNKGRRFAWNGSKVYLSRHMCRQEIVSAVYGAIERAELHEIREWFRYRGASIFNPHLDPDVLAEVARKKSSFNVRANAMSMDEGNANSN
ncbi:hypothetical protein [Rhizobium phage RHEph15]|uniref:Uncharacterized protein n=1 Tax=Rhizobium phage RHph_TM34 TaxID=2509556 RepID=A0A7S5UTL9_9CAUD|nr:hypothetical protein EVB35_013 [Rhizobium phage RHph_TM34]QXV74274.1 hypothetical protein [Rhizobium phage RHEph15]QXV74968.1 hypothetical protein [Rhizobium phage RHEph27]